MMGPGVYHGHTQDTHLSELKSAIDKADLPLISSACVQQEAVQKVLGTTWPTTDWCRGLVIRMARQLVLNQ